MELERERKTESEQQGGEGERREFEQVKKAKGRPTKAEELFKLRGKSDSVGSIKDFIQKRKRGEIEEEAARTEKEILEKFKETRRIIRSPPAKIKKEEERRENMAAEEMLKEILRRMEEQERDRKKDNEELKNEIKGLKEEWKRSEEMWDRQRREMENKIKKLEEKVEKIDINGAEGKGGGEIRMKMKEIERNLEMTERRRRRNNIIVKAENIGSVKERKEKMEKILEEITKGDIEEIQEIGNGDNKMKMWRCRNWEVKREIMRKKKELGRKYECFLDDDLTRNERQIQKEIRRVAREKREAGKRTTIGYQRIWVDNEELKWNEEKGGLEERSNFRRT